MVYELKTPTERYKGVLIFRGLESDYLRNPGPELSKALRAVRKYYVVGVHWGRYQHHVPEFKHVDFHMAAPGTIEEFGPDSWRWIPLCSRDFTPGYFRPLDVPNRWDLVTVANINPEKNLDELLEIIRLCYDAGRPLSVFLLCPYASEETRDQFRRTVRRTFTERERRNFEVVTPNKRVTVENGIPNTLLPYLYNSSRLFALLSEEEGGGRVVSESLLCGTPVVVKDTLRGGAADYLTEKNSFGVSSVEEGAAQIRETLANPDRYQFDPEPLRSTLVEDHSVTLLESELQRVFQMAGCEYGGPIDTESLAWKLPSHYPSIPKQFRSDPGKSVLRSHRLVHDFLWYKVDQVERGAPISRRYAGKKVWLHQDVGPTLRDEFVSPLKQTTATGLQSIEHETGVPAFQTAKRLYNYVFPGQD